MNKCTIGFVSRLKSVDGITSFCVDDTYLKFFKEKNLSCVNITPDNIDEILPTCSCIISTGGVDINPINYNEELTYSQRVNDFLDLLDKKVVLYCKENHIPYLGICRGMQALNVFLGGTLYQDIIKQSSGEHLLTPNTHNVTKINSFGLSELLPNEFKVNHYHHQGLKDIANDFVILYENNNQVEAIEHKTLPLIGVQWHPEKDDLVESNIIFNYLLSKIKR